MLLGHADTVKATARGHRLLRSRGRGVAVFVPTTGFAHVVHFQVIMGPFTCTLVWDALHDVLCAENVFTVRSSCGSGQLCLSLTTVTMCSNA